MKHTHITSSCEFYRTFQGSQTYMICAYISKISNPYIALNLFRETYKYIFIFNHFSTLSCMLKVVKFILRWRQERTRYSLYVLTVAADGLATQGARTSAAMVGANLSRNIPVSAPEWFFFLSFWRLWLVHPTAFSVYREPRLCRHTQNVRICEILDRFYVSEFVPYLPPPQTCLYAIIQSIWWSSYHN